MPASSHASSELSTASLTAVRSAFCGLSKPSRWRFLVKNSETEISRCLAAMETASSRRAGARFRASRRGEGSAGAEALARRGAGESERDVGSAAADAGEAEICGSSGGGSPKSEACPSLGWIVRVFGGM